MEEYDMYLTVHRVQLRSEHTFRFPLCGKRSINDISQTSNWLSIIISRTMKSFIIYLLSSVLSYAIAEGDIFVDDLGFEHKHVDNPKVVMSAQLAVSMHHLGKEKSFCLYF